MDGLVQDPVTEKSAQQEGRDWEPEFAKSIGGTLVPGSGAMFTKLDVRGATVLWSLKHTRNKSFSFKDEYMKEAVNAIHGPGGIGGEVIPGVAFKTADGEYIVFRKDDAIQLMNEKPGIATAASQTKPIDRRPHLLRSQDV